MPTTTPKPPRRGPGRPKDDALQERREAEILDRAAATFATHGYPNTDVQWIADAIGVSKGTIYRYFPSKEELFLAAVRRGVRAKTEVIDAAVAGIEDPIERIRKAVAAYLKFFKENPRLVELFIQERAEFRARRTPVYFEHRDARRGPFRELLNQLITDGRVRPMPVEGVIDVLGDVLYGTMFTNHFAGRNKPYQQQADDVLDVVFNGILTHPERERRLTNGEGSN